MMKFNFSNRITGLWNSLPEKVVTAPSQDSFKNRFDKYWTSKNKNIIYDLNEVYRFEHSIVPTNPQNQEIVEYPEDILQDAAAFNV